MITEKEKQILVEILRDYKNFDKRGFTDEEIIEDLIIKLGKKKKERLIITKTELANELGVTRKTFMNKILDRRDLVKELHIAGWDENQRIFYPNEVKIIKKYMFNE